MNKSPKKPTTGTTATTPHHHGHEEKWYKSLVNQLQELHSKRKKEKTSIAIAVIVIIFALSYSVISRWFSVFNPFKETLPINVNRCTPLEGAYGCENIQVFGDYAFMACSDPIVRQKWFPPILKLDKSESRNDKAFVYNFKEKTLKELSRSHFDGDFRTHGISVIQSEAKYKLYLAFVNHRRSGSCISLFEHRLGTSEMVHYETVCDPLIYAPNDVALVSKHSFYVTNYMSPSAITPLRQYFELATQRKWSNIVFRGEDRVVKEAATGLSGANGIVLNPNRPLVYAASTYRGEIVVYERKNDHLVERDVIQVNFLPDNLSVDPFSGAIYATGFENIRKSGKHFLNAGKSKAYSVVAKLSPASGGNTNNGEIIFADNGSKTSGSTIAAVHHDSRSLLLGGPYQKNVLLCQNII